MTANNGSQGIAAVNDPDLDIDVQGAMFGEIVRLDREFLLTFHHGHGYMPFEGKMAHHREVRGQLAFGFPFGRRDRPGRASRCPSRTDEHARQGPHPTVEMAVEPHTPADPVRARTDDPDRRDRRSLAGYPPKLSRARRTYLNEPVPRGA